jgi:hypothetical protein
MAAKIKLLDDSNGGGNDTSLAHNNAAKDDCLSFNWANTYNLSDLLANDPGSAHGVTFGAGVILNPGGTTFSLAPGVTGFNYTEQIGNGTFSTAHVDLMGRASGELVQNSSFEDPRGSDAASGGTSLVNGVPTGGYTFGPTLPGWTNVNGVSLEDVTTQYGGFSTPGNNPADTHWLDTQASPGGIDISQVLNLSAGSAHMAFVVAAEPPITVPGGQVFSQDPHEKLTFSLDGKAVGSYADGSSSISLADFKDVGAGVFKAFTFDVNGLAAGNHTLEVASSGANAFVGYALDSVSVQQIIPTHC